MCFQVYFVVTLSSFEPQIFRYGERFVDEDLEEMMKNADLDRLVRFDVHFTDTATETISNLNFGMLLHFINK